MTAQDSPAAPSESRRLSARDLALVASFAALLAALGLIPGITPFGISVPISAQTLGVMLAGSILGARRGSLAVLTFLLLVAAGLPLLAGGRGGLGVFAGPSGGFLVGFVVGAYVTGWLVERRPARWNLAWLVAANTVGGVLVVYAFGAPVMAARAGLSVGETFATLLTFVPGDAVKVVVASVVAAAVLRGYPRILPRRAGADRGAREESAAATSGAGTPR